MNDDRRKWIIRIVAGALAGLMLLSALVSGLSLLVNAASAINGSLSSITSNIRQGRSVDIVFKFSATYAADATKPTTTSFSSNFSVADAWWDDSGAKMVLTKQNANDDIFQARITGLRYDSVERYQTITVRNITYDDKLLFGDLEITVTIPGSYFDSGLSSGDGSSGTDDAPVTYTPKILVENAVALDSTGKRIDEVTKDTPSFTLEVVYADIGLRNADVDDLKSGDMTAFFVSGGSFEAASSTKGTVKLVSSGGDYPRFRATFQNVKYTGAGKDLSFQVFYLFGELEDAVTGDGKATLSSAKADSKEEEDKKKMAMSVPKIIISNYTYGKDTIVAGSEFNLDFTVTNTSADLPLENVVVTLTPASNEAATKGPGLIVASSSNTIFVPGIEAGGSRSYSVAFQARPDAEVTSHLITVRFSYEYVDTSLETREKVPDLSESIAIPVSQIDRFTVEPIADTIYAMPGEEAFLTVNFINRGKSTTSNIYGSIRCDSPNLTAAGQPYGNLEAGKADSLDLYLTATEPGSYNGEVVIQYEDENQNVKEISTPFSLYVEQPWYPPAEPEIPPDMNMEPPPAGPGALSIALCVVGGLAIAAPIALYLMKRVRAKGSEDFDELY